jgi:hypothetical protein
VRVVGPCVRTLRVLLGAVFPLALSFLSIAQPCFTLALLCLCQFLPGNISMFAMSHAHVYAGTKFINFIYEIHMFAGRRF